MEASVIKIGDTLGFRFPDVIVKDFDIKVGTKVEMSFKQNGGIILQKKSKTREGWATAFALYAINEEEDLLLPDFLDSETDIYL